MKKLIALFLALMLAFAPVLFAAIEVQDSGTRQGRADKLNFSTGTVATVSGNTATISATCDAFTGGTLTGAVDMTGAVLSGATPLVLEGTTADAYETSIAVEDPTADRTITIPNRTGTIMLKTAPVALTPGAAVALTVGVGLQIYTDTPTDNEDQTITFSGAGTAGDRINLIFTTAGTADEVITFHATLVSSVGTLTLGTAAGKFYTVQFLSDGSHWYEVSRTAVQT